MLFSFFLRIPSSLKSIPQHILLALLLCIGNAVVAETEFDHFSTGFPITGLHVQVACEACHIKGIFKGTRQDCNGCHNGQMAPGKHARHVLSTSTCDNCHSTFSWNTAALDHSSVLGSCRQCHDNGTATGRPARHINTVAECDNCHGTFAWIPAHIDHDVVLGTCRLCHNGVTATGMHTQHISTIEECDLCHSTRAWLPASGFDHSNAAGRCDNSGCHATTKPNDHLPTLAQCDDCHTTRQWSPAVLDGAYEHVSMSFPGKHNPEVGCDSCHLQYPESVTIMWGAFKPYCASCHEGLYRPDAHLKTEEPKISYSVSDLKDCTNGDCHLTKSDGQVVDFPARHFSNSGNF